MSILFLFLLCLCSNGSANSIPRVAVAHLAAEGIVGRILFEETGQGIVVRGIITGMPAGRYGFHIHELGDITSCDTTGAHFNPQQVTHGGRDHSVRHVGDLGNLEFTVNFNVSMSNFTFTDSQISLRGDNNILGRSVVLHAGEDDYGLGNHSTSLTTGNAGARLACGIVGMHAPVEAWNSSVRISPSTFIVICVTLFYRLL